MTPQPGGERFRLWRRFLPLAWIAVVSLLPCPDLIARIRIRRAAARLVTCDPGPPGVGVRGARPPGPVTVARPKLRGTTAAFASRLFGKTITRSNALESLVIAGFVRGLSVRDVENTLADALGAEAALSKSTVSRICQAIGDEFASWSSRRLEGLPLDYLFLDASMFKMHPGARAEPVLAAWGITTDGAPVFVALAAGGSESADAWGGFLDELRGRACDRRCWSFLTEPPG